MDLKKQNKVIARLIGVLISLGSFVVSSKTEAHQDQIILRNYLGSAYGNLTVNHRAGATEGYDDLPYDNEYTKPPEHQLNGWGPKVTTFVQNHELSGDGRHTNATETIQAGLKVFIENSQDFSGSTKLSFKSNTNILYGVLDPQRYYVGEYFVYGDFIGDGSGPDFHEKKNLRNLITSYGSWFDWLGPTNINLLASQTNGFGEVGFGEYLHHRTWNSWYFNQPAGATVSVSNGTSSVSNAQRFNYDDMTNANFGVKVQANEGRHIKRLEIVLQDVETGDMSTNRVGFNSSPGNYTSNFSTNVTRVAGSNAVQNVQIGTNQYTWTVNPGIPEAVVTPGTKSYLAGETATNTLQNTIVYDAENPGKRRVYNGYTTEEN